MHRFLDIAKYQRSKRPGMKPRRNPRRLTTSKWEEHYNTRRDILREPWRLRIAKDRTYLAAICETPDGTLSVKVSCDPAAGQPKGRITLAFRDRNRKHWRPAGKAVNSGCASWRRNLVQRVNEALLPGGPKKS